MSDLDPNGVLKRIWLRIRSMPGWLVKIVDSAGLSHDEEWYLSDLEDSENAIASWHLSNKRRPPEPDNESRASRIRYLDGESSDAKKRLFAARIEAGRAIRVDDKLGEEYFVDEAARAEGYIKYCSAEIDKLAAPEEDRGLRPDMIDCARKRDIRDIVSHKNNMIRCPYHDDKKASMSVAKGFGYCFVCQKSVNAIDWLIEVEHMTFLEAVKRLNGEVPAKILGSDPT